MSTRRSRLSYVFAACLATALVVVAASGPDADALVKRALNLISGTGVTASCVDNFTSGQQDCTFSSTVVGGVSSVTGAGTVSCSPTTGAIVCTGTDAVSSVTGAGATSCSPTTGAVVCTTPSVTLTSGSGISVTGGPAYVVNLAVPVAAANGGDGTVSPAAHGVAVSEGASPFNFVGPAGVAGLALVSGTGSVDPAFNTVLTVGGGTGLNAAGATGNVLTSSSGIWVSSPNAALGLYRLVDRMIAQFSGLTIANWAHNSVSTTSANTLNQIGCDGAAWATLLDPNSHIVSLPTVATGSTVFEFGGVNSGDQINVTFQTTVQESQSYKLVLGVAIKAVGVTPTWPTDYVTAGFSAGLPVTPGSDVAQATIELRLPLSGTTGRLWLQPAVYELSTSASAQGFFLVSDASVNVDIWRP